MLHRRLTSALRTHIDWKWKDGRYFMQMKIKESSVAILTSDKIDIKPKTKKGQFIKSLQ